MQGTDMTTTVLGAWKARRWSWRPWTMTRATLTSPARDKDTRFASMRRNRPAKAGAISMRGWLRALPMRHDDGPGTGAMIYDTRAIGQVPPRRRPLSSPPKTMAVQGDLFRTDKEDPFGVDAFFRIIDDLRRVP